MRNRRVEQGREAAVGAESKWSLERTGAKGAALATVWVALALNAAGDTNTTGAATADLKRLSVEELMEVEITSVSRRAEKLSEVPSAVQVLTGEDVRRSGAVSLVDALRLAPNLQVKAINSYASVVSARGFNALFANKLLVMIDGRTVYTPLFAGVFWDAQNVLLEDLDRIEVVSGPGGTLWGANAVNGVISIQTKSAEETQGLYLSAASGSFLRDFAGVRYGGTAGTNLFYRVYAQTFDRGGTLLPNGEEGMNRWNMTQGGFRMDYHPAAAHTVTVQGDVYGGSEHNSAAEHSSLEGQNVLGRWTYMASEEGEVIVQVYFDRTWRDDVPSTVRDELVTYDLDLQHRFGFGERQSVVWGAGYRRMESQVRHETPFVGFVPQSRGLDLFSGFVQDEITLAREALKLTIGTKLEHNEFSGLEVQPSARLAWTPTEGQTVWGAVSRAVRSPSRIDVDYHIPQRPPFAVAGGPDFVSEKVIAYEIGYRVQPSRRLSLAVAGYYNDYDDLYSVELENPRTPLPYTIQNGTDGQSWGAELSGTFQAGESWRLRGGYSYFHKDLWAKPGRDVTPATLDALGNDPEHQFVVQSMMDLPWHAQLDVTARYVDALPNPVVPSYFTLDVRLAWQRGPVEIALVGQNLWDNQHPEFNAGQEIPRSVYGKVTWRF